MARKIGNCHSCRRAIYDVEGPADACGCDDGVLATLTLREGGEIPHTPTIVQGRTGRGRPNANGDVLPDLDPEMLMSASGRSELANAKAHTHRAAEPFYSPQLDDDFLGGSEVMASAFDISFEQPEEAWPADLPRPTTPSRDRFRVDRGLPSREPFNGRMASGPSDGQVVGRVGQRGQSVPRHPTAEEVRRDIQEWNRLEEAHRAYVAPPPQQEARVVATTRPAGTRPLETRPVDRTKIPTALERLGRTDFEDDPFT